MHQLPRLSSKNLSPLRRLPVALVAIALAAWGCAGGEAVESGPRAPGFDTPPDANGGVTIGEADLGGGFETPDRDAGSPTTDEGAVDPDVTKEPSKDPVDGGGGEVSRPEPACPAGAMAAGCGCEVSEDCLSGYCTATDAGKICVDTCVDSCQEGFACIPVNFGQDAVYLCLPRFAKLCQPCTEHTDCQARGDAGLALCLDYGDEGRFCGAVCEEDTDCPAGYGCEERSLGDGTITAQCVKQDGLCNCSAVGTQLSMKTICAVQNDVGRCLGQRVCGEGGLQTCDAPTPTVERCDDVDNDCNGVVDDIQIDIPCFIESVYGVCQGTPACAMGEQICLGQTPQPEVCNGVDDDCDGEIDESTCDDGIACTNDLCDAAAERCVHQPIAGACSDGDACTSDVCHVEDGCQHAPLTDVACEDGDACTVGDTCVAGECTGIALGGACCETAADCDDGNPCTIDSCDPTGARCVHDTVGADGAACDADGDGCTVGDTCAGGACRPGPAPDCGASPLACQRSVCQSSGPDSFGCVLAPEPEGTGCDDGNVCTTGDTCDGFGACVPGEGVPACCLADADCDDGNACTADVCLTDIGRCQNTAAADGSACNADDDGCTADDSCQAGRCVAGEAVRCAASGPCWQGVCQALGSDDHECVQAPSPVGTECTDEDVCTVGDACDGAGACAPGDAAAVCCREAADCDDGNPCTVDACNVDAGRCTHTDATDGTTCDADGDGCTVDDACVAGACVAGEPFDCADDSSCLVGVCRSTGTNERTCEQAPAPAGTACEDSQVCTAGDACDGAGACASGDPLPGCCAEDLDCDDGNACTADRCDVATGVCSSAALADGATCDADGDPCTAADSCTGGVCSAGAAVDCSDLDTGCEVGACETDEAGAARCVTAPRAEGTPCQDGSPCTEQDTCDGAGACQGGDAVAGCCQRASDCDDENPCTVDSCDVGIGACRHTALGDGTACDSDGDGCTVGDACADGVCLPGPAADCGAADQPCTLRACVSDDADAFHCDEQPAPEGAACDDGVACTDPGTCDGAGACEGGAPRDCAAEVDDPCLTAFCDELEGGCVESPAANGTLCDDGNACTQGDRCLMGICRPGADVCVEERINGGGSGARPVVVESVGFGRYLTSWTPDRLSALAGIRWTADDSGREGVERNFASGSNAQSAEARIAVDATGRALVVVRRLEGAADLYLFDHDGSQVATRGVDFKYRDGAQPNIGSNVARFIPLAYADGTWGLIMVDSGTGRAIPEYIRMASDLTPEPSVDISDEVGDAYDLDAAVDTSTGDAFWLTTVPDDRTNTLYVQRFRADGVRTLHQAVSGDPYRRPRIRALSSGRAMLIREQQEGGRWDLFGEVFGANGESLSELRHLAGWQDQNQLQGDAAVFSDDAIVVVFADNSANSQGYDVWAAVWAPSVDDEGATTWSREFAVRVNKTTQGDQLRPGVTVLDDDDFVVGFVGADNHVYTRRFHRDGSDAPGRIELAVNSTVVGDQDQVAGDSARNGNVMLAYRSPIFAGGDTEIMGRVLDPDGAEVRGEARLHPQDPSQQRSPAVCGHNTGFVAVWDTNGTRGALEGRVFDAEGGSDADVFAVEGSNSVFARDPTVACRPDGTFAIGWTTWTGSNWDKAVGKLSFHDAAGNRIGDIITGASPIRYDTTIAAHPQRNEYAVAFATAQTPRHVWVHTRSPDGAIIAGGVQVSVSDTVKEPSIAVSNDDRLLVCWRRDHSHSADYRTMCRILSFSTLQAFGQSFEVSTPSHAVTSNPIGRWLSNGGFLVAFNSTHVDRDGRAVNVRPYDAFGFPSGPTRLANRHHPGDQRIGFLIPLSFDRNWVGWHGPEPEGEDVGVRARVLQRF